MYSLKVNTITNAQRAVKLLKRYNISSKIGRIKNPSKSEGCGYTVVLYCDNINSAVSFLRENGITVSGIETV